jgi:hypothetical protein
MPEPLIALTSAVVFPPMDLIAPGRRNTADDAALFNHLNTLRSDFNKLLDAQIRAFLDATVSYQPGQVLDVDLSYLGKKRRYYKGAQRFLIRGIEPFFWSNHSGRYTRLFVNLHGLYLAQDGTVLVPDLTPAGIPTSVFPSAIPLERIALNAGGDNATILGVSADQHHRYDVIEEAIRQEEEREQSQLASLTAQPEAPCIWNQLP